MKTFNDCLSVINKLFPSIPSRKRSRLDALSNDRSNTLLSIDRSASGVGIRKMGSQNHASASGFELEQQKSEERTKNTIPSKRTRTSMTDARVCGLFYLSFSLSLFVLFLLLFLSSTSGQNSILLIIYFYILCLRNRRKNTCTISLITLHTSIKLHLLNIR